MSKSAQPGTARPGAGGSCLQRRRRAADMNGGGQISRRFARSVLTTRVLDKPEPSYASRGKKGLDLDKAPQRADYSTPLAQLLEAEPDPERESSARRRRAYRQHARERLDRAISKLSQRQSLVVRDWMRMHETQRATGERWTMRTIAARLGLNENTAASILRVA